FSY
ncbi:Acyltransferase family protein, partial [Haemophilus influenzae]